MPRKPIIINYLQVATIVPSLVMLKLCEITSSNLTLTSHHLTIELKGITTLLMQSVTTVSRKVVMRYWVSKLADCPWPCDLKANGDYLLSRDNYCIKFCNSQTKGSKDILYKFQQFDLFLWLRDLKIDRGNLILSTVFHLSSKEVKRTFVQRPALTFDHM